MSHYVENVKKVINKITFIGINMIDCIFDSIKTIGTYLYVLSFIGWYCIDSLNKYNFFPGNVSYNRILESKMETDLDKSLHDIEKWALNNTSNKGLSEHWWYNKLPKHIKNLFFKCGNNEKIKSMFELLFHERDYDIISIPEMDELYLTGNNQNKMHSDQVFYTNHIDGPFSFFPFCSVYRCLIGINDNEKIETVFPMIPYKKVLKKNSILAFDFNREIHHINERNTYECKSTPRIVMKVHYCIYPKGWYIFGPIFANMNAYYNYLFRQLFLTTIEPSDFTENMSSILVMYGTYGFVYTDMFIGHKNIIYVISVLLLEKKIEIPIARMILFFTFFIKQVTHINENVMSTEQYTYIRDSLFYFIMSMVSLSTN
jgi:hypothetical protein